MLREAKEPDADLTELARVLNDQRDALREFETSTLSSIARSLSEAARALSEVVERQERMQPKEWLTAEDAAKLLRWKSVESFEKSDAPRHYLTPRVIRYHRDELDEWGRRKPGKPSGKSGRRP